MRDIPGGLQAVMIPQVQSAKIQERKTKQNKKNTREKTRRSSKAEEIRVIYTSKAQLRVYFNCMYMFLFFLKYT